MCLLATYCVASVAPGAPVSSKKDWKDILEKS